MKMTPSDYADLKRDIAAAAKVFGAPKDNRDMQSLFQEVERSRSFHNSHPAFVSRTWTRVVPFTGQTWRYFADQGIKDEHIRTALSQIRKELFP